MLKKVLAELDGFWSENHHTEPPKRGGGGVTTNERVSFGVASLHGVARMRNGFIGLYSFCGMLFGLFEKEEERDATTAVRKRVKC